MTSRISDACGYFSSAGYRRLFAAMAEKYRSYGSLRGTFRIERLSEAEAHALSGFLCRSLACGDALKTDAREFREALARTRFADVEPEALLCAVHGVPLVSRAKAREDLEVALEAWIAAWRKGEGTQQEAGGCPEDGEWLNWLTEEWRQAGGPLRRAWSRNPSEADRLAGTIAACWRLLVRPDLQDSEAENRRTSGNVLRERIPVFAQRVLGDPHGLDSDTDAGRLLLRALAWKLGRAFPGDAETRALVLTRFGLLPDDVSSSVLVHGLSASLSDGSLHPGWEGFRRMNSPFYATMYDLGSIRRIFATGQSHVHVEENPAAFMARIERASEESRQTCVLCTAGQPSLAAMLILDELAEGGVELRYSGDFDPEGLQMAQRLILRYAGACVPWRMSADDYAAARPAVPIPPERLRKLDGILAPSLLETAAAMRKRGMAGYQEGLLQSR